VTYWKLKIKDHLRETERTGHFRGEMVGGVVPLMLGGVFICNTAVANKSTTAQKTLPRIVFGGKRVFPASPAAYTVAEKTRGTVNMESRDCQTPQKKRMWESATGSDGEKHFPGYKDF